MSSLRSVLAAVFEIAASCVECFSSSVLASPASSSGSHASCLASSTVVVVLDWILAKLVDSNSSKGLRLGDLSAGQNGLATENSLMLFRAMDREVLVLPTQLLV